MGFLKKLARGAFKVAKVSVNPLSLLKRKKKAQMKIFGDSKTSIFKQMQTKPKSSVKWDS